MSFELEIQYRNWERNENFALFDFKEENTKLENVTFKGSGMIYRCQETFRLIFVPEKQYSDGKRQKGWEPLMFVSQIDSVFKLKDIKSEDEPLLLVTHKGEQNYRKQIELEKGSRIKVGKIWIQLILTEIPLLQGKSFYDVTKSNLKIEGIRNLTNDDYEDSKIRGQTTNDKSIIEDNPFCRFCYSKSITENDSMLILCKCEGTTKYIHSECLSQWISARIDLNKEHKNSHNLVNSMSIKSFQCEICKQYYPFSKIVQLLSKRKDQKFANFYQMKNYLVFSVQMEYDHKIFIINLDQKDQFTIGREAQNQIHVPDPSVSRKHCIIKYLKSEKKLVIFDIDSKFGTAVKKSSILVSNPLVLQKGRTVLNIRRKEKKGFFGKLFQMCSAT